MTDEPPVEALSAPAKKAPAKKAPVKKAPVKKAAVKKAPAKKAPAKKAPVKKAAKGAEVPRASILNRIHELEERIAADAPLPAAARRARPQPALAAPPIDADAAIETAPAAAAASEAVAEPAPVRPKRAPRPKPAVVEPADLEAVERKPVSKPASDVTRVVPLQRTEGSGVRTARVLAGLVVLFLAGAAGMGAAALVKDRPSTWSSESVLTLTATGAPSAEAALVGRVSKAVHSAGFAALTTTASGVSTSKVRAYADATSPAAGQLVIQVHAATADAATLLADSAGREALLTVAADQAAVTNPDRRISAQQTTAATPAVREKPTDRQAWLAGGLAALTVLLVGLVIVVLMTTSKPSS